MPLRIYNTLSRQKEVFEPVRPGKVSMYLCGPTVYKPAHIGHMVGPVIFDTVKRYLAYCGYDVTWVVNVTDVDDKLINRAAESGTTVEALAREMTADYLENLEAMGVDGIDRFPKATEHIPEMIAMIGRLIEQGHAYPLEGDVYFEVTTDDDYGKLSRRSVAEMLAGTRVEANERKRNPADFALWKKSKAGEPAWDSPWGRGRPGWHIECSAMSTKLLGETFDIHGGGLDLLFPHHENELAQSESCTGRTFARYWMHNGLMQSSGAAKVGGAHDRRGDVPLDEAAQVAGKLAGSAGAESVKTAVFAKHHPEAVRFFLLSTHYRSPIDFSLENIAAVEKSLEGFYRLFEKFERITGTSFYDLEAPPRRDRTTPLENGPPEFFGELSELRDRFLEAMDDDFNTGGASGVLFELRRCINGFIAAQKLEAGGDETGKAALTTAVTLLKELSNLLGVFRRPVEKRGSPADDAFAGQLMELLIEVRAEARKAKQFGIADRIRNRLGELNIALEDRPEGTLWRRE
ncbi:MAG: cysteine--tRNA ligase [Planctomycetes bacterium]|nr:cysteine--tRNA ligase [Planctomycetota bacterium]